MEHLWKLSLCNETYYFHDNYPHVWVILCNNVMWIVTHSRNVNPPYDIPVIMSHSDSDRLQRIDIIFGTTWIRVSGGLLNICKTDLGTLNESLNAIKSLMWSCSTNPVSPHDQSFEQKFTSIFSAFKLVYRG